MGKQKCYHMTRFLKDIIKNEDEKGFKGLKLIVGENSKYVSDTKSENIGISYSLGLEGIVATNAMFRARYQYNLLENKTDGNVTLDDMFSQNVQEQEEKFLGSNVYLVFDETDSIRAENEERDIADPKTKSPIDISNIRGVILKNSRTGQIKFDREAIVRYAVNNMQIQDIIKNLTSSCGPFMNMEGYAKTDFSFIDYVRRFFLEVSKEPETQIIGNGDWRLQEIDVKELLKIIEKDKDSNKENGISLVEYKPNLWSRIVNAIKGKVEPMRERLFKNKDTKKEEMKSSSVKKLEPEKLLSWDLRNWNEDELKTDTEQAIQGQGKSKENDKNVDSLPR